MGGAEEFVRERVRGLYWDFDINCARTMLICLGELFGAPVGERVLSAAVGLHGAGGYRAQCGLAEGALMFIGIAMADAGKTDEETAGACYRFAEAFEGRFGSLRCYDLRPNGFKEDDPPHVCESLTKEAVLFAYRHISEIREA